MTMTRRRWARTLLLPRVAAATAAVQPQPREAEVAIRAVLGCRDRHTPLQLHSALQSTLHSNARSLDDKHLLRM